MHTSAFVWSAFLLTIGCGSAQAPVSQSGLIPRATLLQEGDLGAVQLSPDGKQIAFTRLAAQGSNLCVKGVGTGAAEKVMLQSPVQWAWTRQAGAILCISPGQAGDRLLLIAADGKQKDLTFAEGARFRIVGTSLHKPGHAAVGCSSATKSGLFLVNLGGGEPKLLSDQQFSGWLLNKDLEPVGGVQLSLTSGTLYRLASGEWKPVETFNALYERACGFIGASADSKKLYYTGNERTETSALCEIDRESGAKKILLEDKLADILPIGAWIDPRSREVFDVVSYHIRLHRHSRNQTAAKAVAKLRQMLKGDVSIAGPDDANATLLVRNWNGGPASYHLFDIKTGKLTKVLEELPSIARPTLSPRHAMFVKSRDGFSLPTDVYLPKGSDKNGDGVPDKPLPTVVVVHGGPWVGYDWNFWPIVRNFQLLTDRGYAVVRAGFRGEPGFGKKLVEASRKQWGQAMQNDLVDIAENAVKKGISQKGKIGIWGWSYGGYATMAALANTDTFKCGISQYGVADLPGIISTGVGNNPFWWDLVGNPRDAKDREMLESVSPIHQVAKINEPLLLAHGAQDDRVPVSDSDRMADELKKRGKGYTYLRLADDGHDFLDIRSWHAFWAVGEPFLAKHLGGKAEPEHGELKAIPSELTGR